MYNRYIPQPDGSYRRSRVGEPAPPIPPQKKEQPRIQNSPVFSPEPAPACPPQPRMRPRPMPSRPKRPQENGTGIFSFLKQLLPKDFDTEDLMVVLLLLLMSGDCREDQNTALLTLAIYLFL